MHGPSPYNFVDLTTEPPTSPASHESGIVQAVGQSLAVLEGIQTRRGIRKEALRKKIRNASNRRRILVEHYKEMLAQQDNIKAELEEFRTFFENHEARLESGLTSRQNSAVMAIISSVEPVSDQKLRVLETLREDELRNDEEERLSSAEMAAASQELIQSQTMESVQERLECRRRLRNIAHDIGLELGDHGKGPSFYRGRSCPL